MWKAKPKSRVARLKVSLKSVRKRAAGLDGKQMAELAAALAAAATALAAVAAAFKRAKRSSG
jgi:hypothetical protein